MDDIVNINFIIFWCSTRSERVVLCVSADSWREDSWLLYQVMDAEVQFKTWGQYLSGLLTIRAMSRVNFGLCSAIGHHGHVRRRDSPGHVIYGILRPQWKSRGRRDTGNYLNLTQPLKKRCDNVVLSVRKGTNIDCTTLPLKKLN